MENGYSGIGNNDAATLALLSGGNGIGIGNRGANFEFDGSVINANLLRNGAETTMQAAFTRDTIKELGVDNKLFQLLQSGTEQRVAIIKELSDHRMQSARDSADSRAETAACCCETQKLVVSENNATRTLLLEQQIAALAGASASRDSSQIIGLLSQLVSQGGRGPGNSGS
jgi:hypothetical protein